MTLLHRVLLAFVFSFLVLAASNDAHAACVNPAGNEGEITYNTTYKTMQFCDGNKWWSMKGSISGDSLASKDFVNAAIAASGGGGTCYYTVSNNQCGSGFVQMPSQGVQGGSTQYICCSNSLTGAGGSSGSPSFLVLTNGTWNGNLGGLSGANAKCLSDLQQYSWLGKEQSELSENTVKAFLCESSTCNNTRANKTYYFAKSGSDSSGGASFTTDMYGRGPGNSSNWNNSNVFNTSGYWWSNRSPSGNNQLWGTKAYASTCTNWTSSSGSGYGAGALSLDNAGRWLHQQNHGCDNTYPLICIVEGD